MSKTSAEGSFVVEDMATMPASLLKEVYQRPAPNLHLAEDDLSKSYFSPPVIKSSLNASSKATSPTPSSPAAMRFRTTVRRVMAMRRASSLMVPGLAGAEPGIDPRRASAFTHHGHIRKNCVIEFVDYSVARVSFGRMTNRELVSLLEDPRASQREPWARVRWINVGGVSWDVISALALRYNIHPLAVEDILHQHGSVRSKADYYPNHLFLRVLCHKLSEHDADASSATNEHLSPLESIGPDEEESSEKHYKGHESHMYDKRTAFGKGGVSATRGWGTLRRRLSAAVQVQQQQQYPSNAGQVANNERKKRNAQGQRVVHELQKEDRINVRVQPMCILLFRDGTVISISQDSNVNFLEPITERLRHSQTGLRKTADPSLLVHSLLDLIVDQALEIVDEYQGKLDEIEHTVLIKPSMKTVRSLHVLQEDLIGLHRTLEPIKTLVYGLRRYDADRAAATADDMTPGYMSQKAKIYLADVIDHIEHTLMSLDMFAGISENLIDYTFNMVSYQMNDSMRKLTLVTVTILPLTFLTGYFGMNFQGMWSTNDPNISDLLFWEIALPVMAVLVPLFVVPDLQRMVHQIQKGLMLRHMQGGYS
ncbi:hypothetical protein B0H21DRAFT_818847 [Amylocystis lapponica]|nr:hypothetical protein B0H21DRAFT_818847 [Amylocystis lapponica]